MRWLAALLILTGVAFAQSQQPSPSQGKVSQPDQHESKTTEQPPANHERGTHTSPLIVEIANPPNGNAIAGEIKKNSEEQAAENRHATLFNVLLVLVGILQGAALIYTALVTNKAANAAKAAAEALPSVERAYVFLAPEIRHTRQPNVISNTGDIVKVQFAFKNHGKTPAILTKIEAEVRTVDSLPMEIRKNAIELPPGLIISSGETTPALECLNLVVTDDWPKIRVRERLLLFVGAVEYRDVFGKPHTTGFCCDWDITGRGGFSPSPTTKLNYYT